MRFARSRGAPAGRHASDDKGGITDYHRFERGDKRQALLPVQFLMPMLATEASDTAGSDALVYDNKIPA